jgi:hypothetical protein
MATVRCERCCASDGWVLLGIPPVVKAIRCDHKDEVERRVWWNREDESEDEQ